MMSAYDFVHLVLFASNGAIQGRTKLQKTVYFVGALTGTLPSLGYRAHYYGPYSGEVSAAVNELRGLGFLRQTSTNSGEFDPQGFEVARYDYKLTSEGRQIAQEKAELYPHEWKAIKNAVGLLRSMTVQDYVRLSIAAKMLFILKEMGRASLDELLEVTPKFGWNVTSNQLAEAGSFLEALGLVESRN